MTSDEKEQAVKSKETVLTKRRQDTDTKNTMTFRQFCLSGMKKKKKRTDRRKKNLEFIVCFSCFVHLSFA